jgi:hypothetical protein
MTSFANKSFTVAVGSQAYRDNFDSIFKKSVVSQYLSCVDRLRQLREGSETDWEAQETLVLETMESLCRMATPAEAAEIEAIDHNRAFPGWKRP